MGSLPEASPPALASGKVIHRLLRALEALQFAMPAPAVVQVGEASVQHSSFQVWKENLSDDETRCIVLPRRER